MSITLPLFQPAYKLTVMAASSSADGSELSPMTPVPGAIHSDSFKVTTLTNLSGFKPYLGLPQGRKSTYDPTTGKVTNEDLTFRLLDMKAGTSGGNLERWVSAFLGNNSGSMNFINRRVEVEESLDGGTTWSAFYEGRISAAQLDDALWYNLSIKSPLDELGIETFKGRPAAGTTGFAMTSLLPMGLSDTYGPFAGSVGIPATFVSSSAGGTLTVASNITGQGINDYHNGLSTILVGYLQRGITTLSAAQEFIVRFFSGDTAQKVTLDDPSGSAGSRFRLEVRSRNFLGVDTVGEFLVGGITFTNTHPNQVVFRARSVVCSEVPSTDPAHQTLATFHNKFVQFKLVPNVEPISDKNPLFIWGKHPGKLMREVLSWNYGYLTTGSRAPTRPPISYDSASFAAFESGSTYDIPRFKITKPVKIVDFIEKYLCPMGLGYRVDPVYSGSHVISQVSVFDSRIPASASFASMSRLTDDDLADATFTWVAGTPISSVNVKSYLEYAVPVDNKTVATNDLYDIDPWLLAEAEVPTTEFIFENINGNSTTVSIDALGARSSTIAQFFTPDNSAIHNILNYQTDRFSYGPPSIGLKCRRTTTVNGLKLGMWVLVQISLIPDPTGHERGGVRLCQVTEKSEDGLFINLQLSDAGKNVLNLAPSIGTVASTTFDGTNCVNVPVTAITGQLLVVQMSEVASGSAVPAETDPSWLTVVRQIVTTSSAVNYLVRGLRANQTYWFRARTSTQDDLLPSIWTYSAVGYTLSALAAPTSLTYSNITSAGARVSWDNNGDTTSDIQISVASPSGSVLAPYSILFPGTTYTDFVELSNATDDNPYKIGVTHINGGAQSDTPTVSFYLSGSTDTCPAMDGLAVFTPAFIT